MSETRISEAVDAIYNLFSATELQQLGKDSVRNIIQQAIDEATAEKDAEIARLKSERDEYAEIGIALGAADKRETIREQKQEIERLREALADLTRRVREHHRFHEETWDETVGDLLRDANAALAGGEGE